jgi:hypothetical protein
MIPVSVMWISGEGTRNAPDSSPDGSWKDTCFERLIRNALTLAQKSDASLCRFMVDAAACLDGLLTNPERLRHVPGSTRTGHPAEQYTINLEAMRAAILATTAGEQRINTYSQFLYDGAAISSYMSVYIRVRDLPKERAARNTLITQLKGYTERSSKT